MSDNAEYHRPSLFAVMWDCNGLEAVARVPNPEEHTFALLASRPLPEMPRLLHWRLRAQFNTQRHYEIYLFGADASVVENDIRAMFNSNPQSAADTIRGIGHCYYSDRATKKPAIV